MNPLAFFPVCVWAAFFLVAFFWTTNAFGQVEYRVRVSQLSYSSKPGEGLPRSEFWWESDVLPSAQKLLDSHEESTLVLSEEAPISFTGLAIGWKAEGPELIPGRFQLEIRSRVSGGAWGNWIPASGYLAPEDSPSGLFWAMLYVTPDGKAHDEFELNIQSPAHTAITSLKVSAADARYAGDARTKSGYYLKKETADMPDIISREGWWGALPAGELEPDYTPVQIDITHMLVHHTVTSNEPPDPEQVVRQIWDWHVNDNGWSDIGYNFLFDHLGNIYQGRYNPWLETTDVRGAHAGRANSNSTGLAVIGQFEPGAQPEFGDPTAAALDALVKIIAWRLDQNNIDPFSEEWLAVNPNGSELLPVISGHRDVSTTACPGDNLYSALNQIREDVAAGRTDDGEVITQAPFELGQNYPNPFREQTSIPYRLDEQSDVSINLYTVQGERLREIYAATSVEPGSYNVPFDAAGLSSGAYFYELAAKGYRQMKLMIFIR